MPGETGTKRSATDRTDLLKAYKLDQYDQAIFAVLSVYAYEHKASSDYYLHIHNGFLDRSIIIPPKEGSQRKRLEFANKIKEKLYDPKGIFYLTKRSERSISIKGEDEPERKVGDRKAKLFRPADIDGTLSISGETVSTVLQRYARYNEIVLKIAVPAAVQEVTQAGLFSFYARPQPEERVERTEPEIEKPQEKTELEIENPQEKQESDEDSEVKAYRKQLQEELDKKVKLEKDIQKLKKKKIVMEKLNTQMKSVKDVVQEFDKEAKKLRTEVDAARKQGFFALSPTPQKVADDPTSGAPQKDKPDSTPQARYSS